MIFSLLYGIWYSYLILIVSNRSISPLDRTLIDQSGLGCNSNII